MNSPIAHVGKSAAAALPFEITNSKPAHGSESFGAELERATAPSPQVGHNTNRLADRKPAQLRLSKPGDARRAANAVSENRSSNQSTQQAAGTAKAKQSETQGTDTNPDQYSKESETHPKKLDDRGCLAGALSVEAAPTPLEALPAASTTSVAGELDDGQSNGASKADNAATNIEPTTEPSFSGSSTINSISQEQTQSGKPLPAGFELLQAPDATPRLVAPQIMAESQLIETQVGLKKLPASSIAIETTIKAEPTSVESPPQLTTESTLLTEDHLLRSDATDGRLADVPISDAVVTPPVTADRRPARAARRADAAGDENGGGISAAKLAATMKNAPNMNEFAGSRGQDLPGGHISAGRPSPINAARTSAPDNMFAIGTLATAKSLEARGEGIAVVDMGRFEPARIERIGEIISREVRMFKRAADDQVDVVLTPDAKTQISLRLQWRDGQVEVQAKCELGDHHALSLQWAQLQTSLAQQGVRLAPLTERTSTGFTEFFSPSSFSQSQNSGGQRQPSPQPPAPELPPAPIVSASRQGLNRKPAATNDRFETWA